MTLELSSGPEARLAPLARGATASSSPWRSRTSRWLTLILVGLAGAGCSVSKANRTIEAGLPAAESILLRSTNGALTVRVDPNRPQGSAVAAFVVTATSPAKADERAEEVELRCEFEGRRLVVEPVFPGARGSEEGASIEVVVPSLASLEAETSNGSVSVVGVSGDVSASTSNGRVGLEAIGGAVNARSSNGRVELRQIGGAADARTSNGSIEARGVKGSLILRTSNGSIRVEDAAAPIDLTTSNGSLTIELAPDFAGTLELRTSNGSIRIDDAVAASRVRVDRNEARVQFDEAGPSSTGRTSNGSISVRQRR